MIERFESVTPTSVGMVVVSLCATLVGCGSDESVGRAEPRTPVSATTIELRDVEVSRQWHGLLEPLRTYPIQAPRAGRVASVALRDGDPVARGQLLARMESPDLEARRDVLSERVRHLEDELDRWRRLAEEGSAGAGEVAAAELRLLEVRDQMSELEATDEMYQLRAPVAGWVNDIVAGPGVNVTEGQTLLTVEDGAALGMRIRVAASETGYLGDAERLAVVDDRGETLAVERVVLSSDVHPAFVQADVYVSGEGGRRSAMLRFRSTDTAVTVPWTAVASEGDRHWVALVVDGDPPRVERREVQLGRAHGDGLEVLSGLVPGDRVIRYEPRSHPEGRAVEPVTSSGSRP